MGLLSGRRPRDTAAQSPRDDQAWITKHLSDQRTLDAVEALIALAEEAGISLPHMAIAFVIAHPAVTSAIIGPRTFDHLDDLLCGAETVLDDDLLDRIDDIAAPGSDIGPLDVSYDPPPINTAALRRRNISERAAAPQPSDSA